MNCSFVAVVVLALHKISIHLHSFFAKSYLHIPDIINLIITYTER